jgi:hypothetical protein
MKTHFLVSLSYMISATAEFHYREPLTRFPGSGLTGLANPRFSVFVN